jgi:hypothetical protein
VTAGGRLRAVPLTYAGVPFRSTLEADWAATLDSLGITNWKYEPEPYRLPSGELYSPDFWLPDPQRVWLEVKGPHMERIHKTYELAVAVDSWMSRWSEPVVVVGLAPERGRCTLQTHEGGTVHLLRCYHCEQYTFVAEDYGWQCRVCTEHLKLGYFREPTPPFVRARDASRLAAR